MKKMLKLPKFKNEDQERDYWSKVSLADYFEAKDFEKISFPNLKPTSESISIRIPKFMLIRLREKANEMNVPYQSLIKSFIKQGLML